MSKNKTLIQQEREKRQQELAQIEAHIVKRQQELSQLAQARLKTIGCLEQLDALEPVKKGKEG